MSICQMEKLRLGDLRFLQSHWAMPKVGLDQIINIPISASLQGTSQIPLGQYTLDITPEM